MISRSLCVMSTTERPWPSSCRHDLEELVGLLRGEDRGRLVEDEDLGVLAGQGLEDLHALLHAHGEVLDQASGSTARPYVSRQLAHRAAGARSSRGTAHLVSSWPSMTFSATVKTGTSMKCWWTMPMPGVHRIAGLVERAPSCPSMRILPSVRPVQAEQDVHQGGLAGAVLAEQAVDLARLDDEVDRVVRREGAEPLGDSRSSRRTWYLATPGVDLIAHSAIKRRGTPAQRPAIRRDSPGDRRSPHAGAWRASSAIGGSASLRRVGRLDLDGAVDDLRLELLDLGVQLSRDLRRRSRGRGPGRRRRWPACR